MKKISRDDVIKAIVEYRMQFISKDKVIDMLEVETSDIETELLDTIYWELYGCTNGFLSEFYMTLTGEYAEVIGEVKELFACPCCGFKTLTEIYNSIDGTGYDICDYCRWEDDGTTDPTIQKSINRGSMNDYRQKIETNINFYYRNKWFK